MRKRQLVPVLLVALFGFAAVPAVAAGTADSVTERLIWELNNNLMAIAFPITLLVEGILFYTVWKFRKTDEAQPTRENRRLEVTWTIATAIVLLFVGFASYGVMADQYVTATKDEAEELAQQDDTVVVVAEGYQWAWRFDYPQQNVTSDGTLVLPSDRDVVIKTTSTDVLHAFHAPELGLKADAFPGQYNYIITNIDAEGEYTLYCAEYCGTGHSQMLADIDVRSPQAYQEWLDQQSGGGNQTAADNGTASGNQTTTASS